MASNKVPPTYNNLKHLISEAVDVDTVVKSFKGLYGPFCHGAHKLDLSTLFTTFFLWTSPPFIFDLITADKENAIRTIYKIRQRIKQLDEKSKEMVTGLERGKQEIERQQRVAV